LTDCHASIRTWSAMSRPGAHWGSQYQVGAAIFLSASKAREKTRSHREHGIAFKFLLSFKPMRNTSSGPTVYSEGLPVTRTILFITPVRLP
jgi:hypothetical protein